MTTYPTTLDPSLQGDDLRDALIAADAAMRYRYGTAGMTLAEQASDAIAGLASWLLRIDRGDTIADVHRLDRAALAAALATLTGQPVPEREG